MRCLLISGCQADAKPIRSALTSARFSCFDATTGEEALEFTRVQPFELIAIVSPLPDTGSLELVRALRRRKNGTPVVVVGSGMGGAERIEHIEAGADEVFAAVPGERELRARVRQLLVRSHGQPNVQLVAGPVSVDLEAAVATFNGRPVRLSSRVFAVLEALALKKGRLLSREQLIDIIYNGRDEPDVRAIDVFVCTLRRKMQEAGIENPDAVLQTIRGQGFVLCDEANSLTMRRAA